MILWIYANKSATILVHATWFRLFDWMWYNVALKLQVAAINVTRPYGSGYYRQCRDTVKARNNALDGNVSKHPNTGRYFGSGRFLGPRCYLGPDVI